MDTYKAVYNYASWRCSLGTTALTSVFSLSLLFCRLRVVTATCCHWPELPQVSFLSRQSSSFVATKLIFCYNKRFVSASIRLSRKKTCFVATNTCSLRQNVCRHKNDIVAAPANDNVPVVGMSHWASGWLEYFMQHGP